MKKFQIVGAVAAVVLLSATAVSAQSTDTASSTATVATTSTAPLIPGGAAGEPARSPVSSFWASLTGSSQKDAKTSKTASVDTDKASTR